MKSFFLHSTPPSAALPHAPTSWTYLDSALRMGKQGTYCYYLNTFQQLQNSITTLLAFAILVHFAFRSHQQHSTLFLAVVGHRRKQRKQETLDREHEIKQHHHHRKAIS
jgi:hypothetical protein